MVCETPFHPISEELCWARRGGGGERRAAFSKTAVVQYCHLSFLPPSPVCLTSLQGETTFFTFRTWLFFPWVPSVTESLCYRISRPLREGLLKNLLAQLARPRALLYNCLGILCKFCKGYRLPRFPLVSAQQMKDRPRLIKGIVSKQAWWEIAEAWAQWISACSPQMTSEFRFQNEIDMM